MSRRAAGRVFWPLALLLLPLTGCVVETAAIGFGLNAASLQTTGKNMADLAVSAATMKDCSTLHLRYGKDYCRDLMAEALSEAMKPRKTCFRSLGQIQCYEGEFDPYGTRYDPVPQQP